MPKTTIKLELLASVTGKGAPAEVDARKLKTAVHKVLKAHLQDLGASIEQGVMAHLKIDREFALAVILKKSDPPPVI